MALAKLHVRTSTHKYLHVTFTTLDVDIIVDNTFDTAIWCVCTGMYLTYGGVTYELYHHRRKQYSCRQVSNIRRTKSQHLKDSRTVL